MREQHTSQTISRYLDTPGGRALCGQHGGRQQAAAAMAEGFRADLDWRRRQAEAKYERYPERYESPAHAMADVAEPPGGSGAWLAGSSDEVVAMLRWADPAWRWRNLGYEDADADTHAAVHAPGRGLVPADTSPPWQREPRD